MTETDVSEVYKWFEDYADRFMAHTANNSSPGTMRAMMHLKREHSLRVAAEARSLASDLGWNPEDQNAAEALGLLHDTGRFSQMAEFGTFRDTDSVNHALRGYQVIRDEGVLRKHSLIREQQILEGIRWHNGLRIPESLPADHLLFIHLIRDADKLDIFLIFRDAFLHNRLQDYPEIIHHVDIEGPASADLLAEIQAKRVPSYRMIRSLNDWKLLQISWAFDLHYRPTCQRVLQRGVLGSLADLLSATEEICAAIETAKSHLKSRCA